jgi:hypothetical protein
MQKKPDSTALTAADVLLWLDGKADEQTASRIEEDLKRSDSEVQHYLDWTAGRCPVRPNPKLVQEALIRKVESAGSARAFTQEFTAAMEEANQPQRENPAGLKVFDPEGRRR